MDRQALGARGTPFEFVVERGKIAEFARAVHAEHPDHRAAERAIAPPTFLTTQFFWQQRVHGADTWALVGMSEQRGMHAEQEYVFHGPPPRAGDRLVATSTIAEITDKASRGGGTLIFVKQVTAFREPDTGRLVAEAILVGVECG